MKYVWTLLLCIAITIVASTVSAQTIATDLSLDIVPLNPEPGATVTLSARSYGVDLTQATLVWTYNNAMIAQGIGVTSVSVVAPASGATGVVGVTVSGSGIDASTATTVLRPASVDLLWEAVDAYTPPFYKGKALLPVGGLVRVTGIPSMGAPRNLTYEWSRNNSVVESASGFGKSSMLFTQSPTNPQEKIDVAINSGSYSGMSTLRLAPYSPMVIAYQNKEGFVDYAKGSADRINLNTPGVVLHFEPYYFSAPTSVLRDLSMTTTVDGKSYLPAQQNEIGLSRPATGAQSDLKLAITTAVYSLQHLEKTFTILFN